MLVSQTPYLSYLRPATTPGELHDLHERCVAVRPGPGMLELRGRLPPGLYQGGFVTAAGTFATETLMLRLTEWPSRATVTTGPWDFDHTQYRMVQPVFRVAVNGEDQGVAWCSVPSPDELAARRIRCNFGFRVPTGRPFVLRLEIVPEDRARLRWEDVEEFALAADERFARAVPPPPPAGPALLATPARLAQLRDAPDPVQRALLAALRHRLERGDDNPYDYRTIMAAVVGVVTGEAHWRRHAIERVLALARKPHWGYHDRPWIMGWNNDRDAGLRMAETAFVLDWLETDLAPAERDLLRAKLAYHADLAWRFTTVLRNYWYFRTMDAHGQGFWFGFAAAAAVLRGHDPMAERWLAWCHGNLLDALAHLPPDGVHEWYVFNVQWHILGAALFEGLLGRRLRGRLPFLPAFAANLPRLLTPGQRGPDLPPLLFYLAARHRRPDWQATALAAANLAGDGTATGEPRVDVAALLAYDPTIPPGTAAPAARAVRARNGTLLCRTTTGDATFTCRIGAPLTPPVHHRQNWINQSWYHVQHAGSYAWEVAGVPLVPSSLGGYRNRAEEANLITLDGGGLPADSRWLGFAADLRELPFVEHWASAHGVTTATLHTTAAYLPACGVVHSSRRWVFLHDLGVLLLLDRMETRQPRRAAWHLHANRGGWTEEADGWWYTRQQGATLATRLAWSRSDAPDAKSLAVATVFPQWVPGYTWGLNSYRTMDWQPHVRPKTLDIPDFLALRVAPTAPTTRWELLTVQAIGTPPPVLVSEGPTVLIAGEVQVSWGPDSPTRCGLRDAPPAGCTVRLRRHGRTWRWLTFATVQPGQPPADLQWSPRSRLPRPLPAVPQ